MREIIDHMRGTVEILDGIHAEPDALLAIGAAISRLESLIELLENEGGFEEKRLKRSLSLARL